MDSYHDWKDSGCGCFVFCLLLLSLSAALFWLGGWSVQSLFW